ncbi:unnamed protein product [Linum tenue]|uniref:RRM domain-containing protein n=1 Tax=Linum tenue TaxID=586396 RepID=A0AAV0I3D1_9ROSI|nr:unnamed protein product [Linum tenue]
MPRTRENEKSVDSEPEEQVDLEDDNDLEEQMEEEVEYEEVEEEVEEEEVEEEEVEEEVEEDEEDTSNGTSEKGFNGEEESEEKKHAELLALPPHGSEVYVGGIPHDVSEHDLRHFCESVGEVTEVRIMKGKESGEGKGYAFVTFRTKELANKAMKDLNNSEFKGKKVKCSASQANHRLFIGNIPRSWGEKDMKNVVMKIGPGVVSVELLKDPQNPIRNRGFAFLEYYNHACAEYSRKKMSTPEFKLDDNAPTVSWADPKNAGSSAASQLMMQVRAIYVKNLPKDITQDQLRQLFEHHGNITKVVLPPAKPGHERSRFGFVHFSERSSAMKALKNTERYEIDGQVLDCSLAKPQADNNKSVAGTTSQKAAFNPSFPPGLGYGLVGNPYGAIGGYGAAAFAQPLIYGRGPTPASMAMMPMFLPDGRVGYVLQQPEIQPHPPVFQHRGGRGGGSSSSGSGKRYNDSNRGRGRYNPY